MASFEEALILTVFECIPSFYDMSLKDYKSKKMKANVWKKIPEEMRVSGYNVTGTLILSMSENFAIIIYSSMWIVEETIDVLSHCQIDSDSVACFISWSLCRQVVGPQRPGDSDSAFIAFKFHGSRFPGKVESRHFFLVISKGAIRSI